MDSLLNQLLLKVPFPKVDYFIKRILFWENYISNRILTAAYLFPNSTIALPFLTDDITRATTSPYCKKITKK